MNDRHIISVIEQHALVSGDQVALVYKDRVLSYRELNGRANQLAYKLRKKGLKQEGLVAIALPKSIESIITILAIWKAGGAYLPLDYQAPQARLSTILKDSQVQWLITDTEGLRKFPEGPELINIDDRLLFSGEDANLNEQVEDHQLAYVIYTSGSTGHPKGVMIEHASLQHYLDHALMLYRKTPSLVSLFHSSIAFDLTITSLYLPLLVGGKLYIMDESANIEDLAQFIHTQQDLNLLKLTPAHLKALNSYLDFSRLSDMSLIVGGEQLSKDEIVPWLNAKNIYVFNEYGPTETTVGCTALLVTKTHLASSIVPIGSEIGNTKIYLLDKKQKRVDRGQIGEVFIGGPGLARGYLHQPELTEEKFVPNPFMTLLEQERQINLKLYRSGDLAKYNEEGVLVCLGREDEQVKIQGFRIELQEIENALNSHGDVAHSCIQAVPYADSKKLVAYVVPGEFTPSEIELRDHLQLRLPEYMIPTFFIYLEKIPLTLNGKVDKTALPLPTTSFLQDIDAEQEESCSPLEQELKEIWKDVLKTTRLSIEDNFYRIGGDSIISLQLVAKARRKGLYFTVQDLFNHPTIAHLALVVKQQVALSETKEEPHSYAGIVPLSPIQLWFFQHNFPDKNYFNQAILLAAPASIDVEKLNEAFVNLLKQHAALRFRFTQAEQGAWQQEARLETEEFHIKIIKLPSQSAQDIDQTIKLYSLEIQQRLEISQGKLIEAVWFDCGDMAPTRLLIVIHHLVVDTVSWRVLIEDLEILYRERLKALEGKALPQTSSYYQWMNSLLSYARSDEMALEKVYWKKIEEQIIPFPEDVNLGPLSNQAFESVNVSIARSDTLRLLQEVNKAYRTQINDILLAALVLASGDVNNDYRLSFCLEGHGREEEIGRDIDLSRTVGWFTSLFPVVLNVEQPSDLASVIKYVKETLRAIPRKGIGYGLLNYVEAKTFFDGVTRPNLIFNYLGQWENASQQESTFKFVENLSLSKGCVSPNNAPFFPIEVNAEIKQDTLNIIWGYSTHHFKRQTIENLADAFQKRLTEIIQYCCHPENFGYTPTDFKLTNLKQEEIDGHFSTIRELEDIYPLSSMQFGILFHHLYAPQSKNYFVQSIFRLCGHISLDILQQACQRVSDKHAILRTGFVYEGMSEAVQYVVKTQPVDIGFENWEHLALEDQEKAFEDFLLREQVRGFDLQSPQLFRVRLIQTGAREYYFCWAQHHILLDGWSSSLILNDVFSIYKTLYQRSNLPVLTRPLFRHFVEWQKIKQEDIKAKEFWQNYLASLEDVTYLGSKSVASEEEVEEYATCSSLLSKELTAAITDFAQRNHLTVNTVILAAVLLTLKSYLPYQELVIGVTVSGRHPELAGVEDIAGLLINTLPLRVSDPPVTRTRDFLKHLQDTIHLINQYSYLPLAEVQSLANTDRHLFNTIFVFEKYPIDESLLDDSERGFAIEEFIGIEHTEYPLTITALQGRDLEIILNYQTALFSNEMIKRMLNNFLHTITQILENTELSIQDIETLASEEKQKVIEWGASKIVKPWHNTLHALFEAQVRKTPTARAMICEGQAISYQLLNDKANQLAYYLRSQGVGNNTVIAVFCDRSLTLIIAIMAVLKAGAAYVPVDSGYPVESLAHILEDSQASFLLTQSHHIHKVPKKTILLDLEQFDFAAYPTMNIDSVNTERDLAYIIYTSGSTGKPKGVMIEHASICGRIAAYQDNYPLGSDDTVLCQTSISFDVSLAEIFWPFSMGAKVVLSTQKGHEHLVELESLIFQYQVTFAQFVPSVLKVFLMHVDENKPYALKCICSGGEVLDYNIVEEFYRKFPYAKLENAYGPTEATIDATIYPCSPLDKRYSAVVPIGRPLANGSGYILNPSLQPVPIGVVGELYLGGVTVALGYLNREDLNKKSFLNNPFIVEFQQENRRLYKTGDLCRWREDGQLEYVSRADNQIKIRGFRVELEEIEEVLLTHFGIKDAVVIVKEDKGANKQLIAYIVKNEEALDFSTVRRKLANLLPNHMIPNDFVLLEHMPLTTNGKADRRKIAHIPHQAKANEKSLPTTPLEQQLSQIWQEILHRENISIDENFFFLGGNSILATQLILLLKKSFHCEVSLAQFFSEPTIANLAKVLSSQNEENYSSVHEKIKKDIELAKRVNRQAFPYTLPVTKGDILLTGANGFLGVHLLQELIQQTSAKVYCLLRGKNDQDIRDRLIASLRYYQLSHLIDEPRIIPIKGDLGQVHLGLSSSVYQLIVETVEEIYHNGALVHHIYDYSRLQKENVHSTIEMLRLAAVGYRKKIHFISTLSTALDKDEGGRALECFVRQPPVGNEGGYTLSKWAAEKILADAVERGFDCTIHRLPQIMGHSDSGVSPIEKTHIILLMRNWVQLGIAPKNQGNFEFLPVDFTANAIVKICRNVHSINQVVNYGHPESISFEQVIGWLNEFGYKIDLVDLAKWQQEALARTDKEDALYPILSLYADYINQEEYVENIRSGLKKEDQAVIDHLRQFIMQRQAHFPVLDKALFVRYFRYLQSWFNQ